MEICEDCIKQDVCKFKKEIEEYMEKGFYYSVFNVPKPLKTDLYCKEKRVEPPPPHYTIYNGNTTSGTTTAKMGIQGVDWDYTGVHN